jgi:flavin-dependent dehydrogenase
MQEVDIAIIGGGLGGLTMAIEAAQHGYSVMLFEKEQYPFHKVCGEYISYESWDYLERCGIPLSKMQLPSIHKLAISDLRGKVYDFDLPLGGFGISRYTLDHALANKAIELGVELKMGEKVKGVSDKGEGIGNKVEGVSNKQKEGGERQVVETDKTKVAARVVIGAFGKRSNLDIGWKRKFIQEKPNKINNYIGVKYHIYYPNKSDTIALHNFSNGYCGMSSIEDGKTCLCYLTTAENLRRSNNQISVLEKNILAANPQLKMILENAERIYAQPEVISQISFAVKEQVQNNILFIGDAAGMITPLCGNGMSMAMHAAHIAFHYTAQFLQDRISRKAMEMMYTKAWNKEFAFRTSTGRMVQRFFGGAATGTVINLLHKSPALSKKIISLTHGKPF